MHVKLVEPLEASDRHSALASARLRRSLTLEEAASRAGLSTEQAEWLEDGRLYRFPSGDDAVLAALLYATALGIERREARRMAGLRNKPRPLDWNPVSRVTVGLCALIAIGALLAAVIVVPRLGHDTPTVPPAVAAARVKALPPPWKISVDVLNGSGNINTTRELADQIGALGYQIKRVTKANRFDYPRSIVYYPPGERAIGVRLATKLGIDVEPLPGGKDKRRLVVISGLPHY